MNEKMILEIEKAINEVCNKYNKDIEFYYEEIETKTIVNIDIIDSEEQY